MREYRPADAPANDAPAVVYLHGGGWVVGDVDTYDELCIRIANASGGVVYSVDYRRAPECPYPAAADDAEAVVRWLAGNQSAAGVDPNRIVVAGDSAGGNLAAVVALRLRDQPLPDGVRLAGHLLFYPCIDASLSTESVEHYADGYFLTRAGMEWYWNHYCPDPATRMSPDASPINAVSLAGLPRLAVVVASHDPLRDEGFQYAERARDEGVDTVFREAVGQLHGFIRWTAIVDEATDTIEWVGELFRSWWGAVDSDGQNRAGE
ncbi:alpha/beta hydrolase [Phytohabitans kaempferiae]|uniref:Alpha/beta hydrolase n=1 Tax=Phytohabitans kaempferiae TaxID=1620943 RepID=A0ABV6M3F4_9ACTN